MLNLNERQESLACLWSFVHTVHLSGAHASRPRPVWSHQLTNAERLSTAPHQRFPRSPVALVYASKRSNIPVLFAPNSKIIRLLLVHFFRNAYGLIIWHKYKLYDTNMCKKQHLLWRRTLVLVLDLLRSPRSASGAIPPLSACPDKYKDDLMPVTAASRMGPVPPSACLLLVKTRSPFYQYLWLKL